MTKDTHVACGLTVTLALAQPQGFRELAVYLAAASIGSVISDIDVTTSESRKDLNRILLVSIIAIAICIGLEFFFKLGILNLLQSQTNIFRIVFGFLSFLLVCMFGINTSHRTFMHSIPCLAILSGIAWLTFPSTVLPFAIAMLSHIFLDFFNTKKVQIFYPLKKPKIAFKVCKANSKINKNICKITSAIFILEIVLFLVLRIVTLAKSF